MRFFVDISFVSVSLQCSCVSLALISVAKENEAIIVWLEKYISFFFLIV